MENHWQQAASAMWQALLSYCQQQRNAGSTLEQIAKQIGVNSNSVVGEWLNGNRKAENAPFATLMLYMERAGINYREYFPDFIADKQAEKEVIQHAQAEISRLTKENEGLRTKLTFFKGEIQALERQIDRQLEHMTKQQKSTEQAAPQAFFFSDTKRAPSIGQDAEGVVTPH